VQPHWHVHTLHQEYQKDARTAQVALYPVSVQDLIAFGKTLLGSFGNRIRMAHAMGLIDNAERKALGFIRGKRT
jgi:hypothetical protein